MVLMQRRKVFELCVLSYRSGSRCGGSDRIRFVNGVSTVSLSHFAFCEIFAYAMQSKFLGALYLFCVYFTGMMIDAMGFL